MHDSSILARVNEIGCWIIDVCGLLVRMPCLFSKSGTKNFSRLLKKMNDVTVAARTLIAYPENRVLLAGLCLLHENHCFIAHVQSERGITLSETQSFT